MVLPSLRRLRVSSRLALIVVSFAYQRFVFRRDDSGK